MAALIVTVPSMRTRSPPPAPGGRWSAGGGPDSLPSPFGAAPAPWGVTGVLRRVKKTVLLYGLLGGVLIALLKVVEYRYLVIEHSLELYGGVVALLFAVVGIWLGQKLTRERVVTREVRVEVPVARGEPFVRDQAKVEELGLTPRELDILEAVAAGLSNREIAERLFVSENTVKTHAARLFSKLSARRRTQAVQLAKEAGLIP